MDTKFSIITTRRGDEGKSSLRGGARIYKDEDVFNILGDLDELNSFIGMSKAKVSENCCSGNSKEDEVHNVTIRSIDEIQALLLELGGVISSDDGKERHRESPSVSGSLEKLEQYYIEKLRLTEIPDKLIHPGSNSISASFDISRTVCRRFERGLIHLYRKSERKSFVFFLKYINRLSDYLYILARYY